MIPKSGNRFSDKIMLQQKEHDPEKWESVFGRDHAPTKGRAMIAILLLAIMA